MYEFESLGPTKTTSAVGVANTYRSQPFGSFADGPSRNSRVGTDVPLDLVHYNRGRHSVIRLLSSSSSRTTVFSVRNLSTSGVFRRPLRILAASCPCLSFRENMKGKLDKG